MKEEFTFEELILLENILADRIYDGAYPSTMKKLLNLYEKIDNELEETTVNE